MTLRNWREVRHYFITLHWYQISISDSDSDGSRSDVLQRVDHLLKQEKFMEALSLAWSFHEGTAKAVLGQSFCTHPL